MRRLAPRKVFVFSLTAALLCLVLAGWALSSGSPLWAAIAVVLGLWFAVDAYRAHGWQRPRE